MNKKLLIALVLSGALALTGGLAACGGDDPGGETHTQHVDLNNDGKCDECGEDIVQTPPAHTQHVDLNNDGKCDECGEDMPGKDPATHAAPVIKVTPDEIEIYAGDKIDLMFGVSATDDEGNPVDVTIEDSGDFDEDNPAEGEYTVTYKATAFGLTSKATRKITVAPELAPIIMQARTEWEKPGKWEKTDKIQFRFRDYHEITADEEFDDYLSGVFHNTTEETVVVSVKSGGGAVAITDKNGKIVEARDGANGKLINAENPVRATSSATTFKYGGTTYQVAKQSAAKMQIPAGGFAIVVNNNYLGPDADSDGRQFMNYNVINEYGNVIRVYWSDADEGEYLTEYVNQAPKVQGNTDLYVLPGDKTFNLETEIKAGLKIMDDNGVFAPLTDVTAAATTVISVLNADEFDVETEGDYVIRLTVTDGLLTTDFTRAVKVVGEEYVTTVELASGDKVTVLSSKVSIDKELTKIGANAFIIYTYEYKSGHASLGFANGYGTAYVVDRYGKIARVYDGANGKYSDATQKDVTGIVNSNKYAEQAYESLQEGEIVVIAPHDGGVNSAAGGSRHTFMQLKNRTAIGTDIKIKGIDFEEKPFVLTAGDKTISALESKYAFNKAVSDTSAVDMAVYTKAYGATNPCAGWSGGRAAVVDRFGELIKLYDGVSAKVYDKANANGATVTGFTSDNYAEYAYTNLGDGERLIVFLSSNNIAAAAELAGLIGTDVTFTDVTFAERTVEFAVGGNKLTIALSEYSLNGAAADAAKVEVYKDYGGAASAFAGYDKGVAVIINKFGEISAVYDGVNGKLYNAENADGVALGAAYAATAYAALTEGDMLVLFKGETGDHVTYALALNSKIDETVTFTDINFKQRGITLSIKNKTFFVAPQYYLEDAKPSNAANYQALVYTPEYTQDSFGVGWNYGAALIINAEGKLVRIYDGANGGIWEDEKIIAPAGFATNKYAEFAYAYAKENNYTLIVFPNSSIGSGNPARAFALGLRPIGGVGTGGIGETLTIEDTRKA